MSPDITGASEGADTTENTRLDAVNAPAPQADDSHQPVLRQGAPAPEEAAKPDADAAPAVKPTSTPLNEKRERIAREAAERRRQDQEFDPAVLFGKNQIAEPEAPAEPVDARETLEDVAAREAAPARQPAPQGKPAPDRQVQMVVNRQPVEMSMSAVRAMVAKASPGEDLTGVPEGALIASARMLLASEARLSEAKQQAVPQPAPQPQRQPDPEPAPADMGGLVETLLYGDQAEAEAKLAKYIDDRAAQVAVRAANVVQTHVSEQAYSRSIDQHYDGIVKSISEHADPEVQKIAADPVFVPVYSTMLGQVMTQHLESVLTPEEVAALPTLQDRGRTYRELRSRGVRLPPETALMDQAKEATLQRLGPVRAPTPVLNKPTVSLTPARQARAQTVSPQPRASGTTPPQASAPLTPSSIIQGMRKARGQPTVA
jgi:hypothetical protein